MIVARSMLWLLSRQPRSIVNRPDLLEVPAQMEAEAEEEAGLAMRLKARSETLILANWSDFGDCKGSSQGMAAEDTVPPAGMADWSQRRGACEAVAVGEATVHLVEAAEVKEVHQQQEGIQLQIGQGTAEALTPE